ncbi:MAG: hypothetical protein ACN6O6_18405 [Pseudomonas sp.]|uniref:hypothetical protein n=1 Tax=Pseudomonas sp. TaxID=306 RepID=UPI003D0A3A39
MKDPHDLTPHEEQQVLQHYRAHSDAEPSADLDARILAAAAQATRQAEPVKGPLARLHGWLFGGAGRPRWSVAFGSLALLGLGLGLSLKTLEQVPTVYDSPEPAPAAAMQRYAPAASMERKALAESSDEGVSAMADSAMPEALRSSPPAAAPLARSSSETEAWVPALQEVLALRKRGEQAQATALLEEIQRRYPQQDMDEQLRHLQEQDQ